MQTIPQNAELVAVSVRIRKPVDRALELECARIDCTKQQLIEGALMKRLGLREAAGGGEA